MAKFSILIPVYNAAKFLDQTMEGLLNQTFSDIEIVLVNDGSKDNSGEVCDAWAAKDKRVRAYHQKNGGAAAARNTAMDNATGDYIWFVDSDDRLEPDALERISKHLNDDEDHVLVFSYYIVYPDHTDLVTYDETMTYTGKEGLAEAVYQMDMNLFALTLVWNKVFSRKFIEKNHIRFNTSVGIGEDLIFVADALPHIRSITLMKDILYHYIKRESDSLSSKFQKHLYDYTLELNDIHSEMYAHLDMTSKRYQDCLSQICFHQLFATVVNLYRLNASVTAKERQERYQTIFSNEKNRRYIQNGGASFYAKLMRILLRINNPALADFMIHMLMKFRYTSKRVYPAVRAKFLLKWSPKTDKTSGV